MISFIREKMGTRWLNAFIWVAILSMSGVLFMTDLLKLFKKNSDYAIRVNGTALSNTEFEHGLQSEKEKLAYMQQQYGDQVMQMMLASQTGFSLDPVQNIVNNFILSTLINQAGEKLKLIISSEAAQKELLGKLPAALVDQASGKIDRKAVQQAYKQSVSELEKLVAKELQATLVLDLVSSAALVGQFEIDQDYGNRNGQKKFAVITFSAKEIVAKINAQKISDHELAGYFKQQNDLKKRYWTEEVRAGRRWELTQKDFAIKVSEQDVSHFYHKNKKSLYQEKPAEIKIRRILIPKKADQDIYALYTQAKELRNKLVSGQDSFANHQAKEAIIKQSTDKAVGVEKAAFALKMDGEISPAIELPNGIEIIQRISRIPATFKSLESLKSQITKELTVQKFRKVAEVTLRRISNSATGVQQFKAFADKKNISSENLAGTVNDQSPQVRALFSIKSAGKLTYNFDGDKLVVEGLASINKAHVKKLDEIRATVLQDYQADLVAKAIQAKLNQVKQAYASKKVSFDSLAKQFDGELYTTKELTRSEVYEDTQLRAKRIPLDVVWDLAQVDAVTTYVTRGDEFLLGDAGISRADRAGYVIRLVDLKLPVLNAEMAKKKAAIAKTLQNQRNYQWQQGFIASLGKNARIETNKTLLKATK
jgi:hypothetical protein